MQAAAVPLSALTAWQAIHDHAKRENSKEAFEYAHAGYVHGKVVISMPKQLQMVRTPM